MNLISHLRKVTSLLISLTAALLLVLGLSFTSYSAPAIAGIEPFVGEIEILPYQYCPEGFLEAKGQLLAVNQYQALFSLLGTAYGGNGATNFALPNLAGRFPIGVGNPVGLPPVAVGQMSGSPTVTLTPANLPAHTHPYATTTLSTTTATTDGGSTTVVKSITPTAGSGVTGATGGSAAISIANPSVGIRYCIATQGIYPQRP